MQNKDLPEFYRALVEQLTSEDSMPAVINPERIMEFAKTAELLNEYATKHNMKITYNMHSPLKSMGYISVQAKTISLPEHIFKTAASTADTVDIYPKTNGVVQIDFVFHNLTNT